MKSHYALMAQYNRWMNQNLYAVCADIADEKRKADLGAFFKSIHSTFNHMLWADRAWLTRLSGQTFPSGKLGEDLYDDFATLRQQREILDEFMVNWVAGLSSDWFSQTLQYTSVIDGKTRKGAHRVFIAQLFNHQTHHRGQITTLINQLGYAPGATDIPWMPGAIEVIG